MNIRNISIFIIFTLLSCGSNPKVDFKLNIISKSDFLKNGDQIEFSVVNVNNEDLSNLEFTIENNIISSPYILNNKLGVNTLNASFYFKEKKYTVKKDFNIYSSIKPSLYTYNIINEYNHDINSYTQGLEFDSKGVLYEGTGQYGSSTLQKYNYKTGRNLNKIFLDKSYFGEGITILNNKVFQLTWKSKIGFIYNLDDFKLINSFNYNISSEGWGLCNDGNILYKSDGTEKIWKLNPESLEEMDYISVVTNNKIINKINELEWHNNKIYANTYQFNKEVGLIIEPTNGQVEGVIDFTGLKERVKNHPKLDVLNGIAYNKITNTFFVTGKNWNKLFEIEIIKKN